jgi:hypothetical protein
MALRDFRPVERYVVKGKGFRRVFTDWDDALAVVERCAKERRKTKGACTLYQGMPGAEQGLVQCKDRTCRPLKAKVKRLVPRKRGGYKRMLRGAGLGRTKRRKRRR